jgi:hypothetical protein
MDITVTKFLLGIVVVFGIAAVAVSLQHNSRQVATDTYMLMTKILDEQARQACPEAVRKHHTNLFLGAPTAAVSDGDKKLTLSWSGGAHPPVVCTYVMDQGIESLTIDGKPVGS